MSEILIVINDVRKAQSMIQALDLWLQLYEDDEGAREMFEDISDQWPEDWERPYIDA